MQTSTIVSPKVSRGIGTALTQVGAYSPATSCVVTGLCVANISGASVNVTVTVYDGTNDTHLTLATPVAAADSLLLGAEWFKFTLVSGWSIRVSSSVASSVDASMFVTEFT
jgi:hypothetical protein